MEMWATIIHQNLATKSSEINTSYSELRSHQSYGPKINGKLNPKNPQFLFVQLTIMQ